ncbi:hypothetical protein VB780_28870 [Leptolyngbya sp. CCNP1308]|uniref:hypothetical protein n=1 Tax=Leptolyngbya sp. CCNP1308 TaxID=3110255 RepID=UPI002B2078E8|nr:hypothetical protein [Leptolyngbya sp. CCNP1308]MEA5452620.1 hypothetical protein [Leptolyngbya sp. CCNP1308]
MRYSIMLQLVVATTLVLTSAAAFFAWLQNRPIEIDTSYGVIVPAVYPVSHG